MTLMISSITLMSAFPTGSACPMPSTRYGVASGTRPDSLYGLNIDPYGSAPTILTFGFCSFR